MRDFEQVFNCLKEYKAEFGHCKVPLHYVTENGVKLGVIVMSIRSGNRRTNEIEKKQLSDLGFVWRTKQEQLPFQEVISLLEEYKAEYGDCKVPYSYITENGICLGKIVQTVRSGAKKTTDKEKNQLNDLGFVWRLKVTRVPFQEVVKLLRKYKKKHGNCLVPVSYVTKDGIGLGQIVHNIRGGSRKTSEEQKAILSSIGFVWKIRTSSIPFEDVIKLIQKYKEENGDCLVPSLYVTEEGIRLGKILQAIRTGKRTMTLEEKEMLNALGFVWKTRASPLPFDKLVNLIKEYKEKHGDCLVPQSYVTEEGITLGKQVQDLRSGNRKISEQEKMLLDDLGFVWRIKLSPVPFEELIRLLKAYKNKYGDCLVPRSYTSEEGIHLGVIVSSIRSGKRKTSSKEKIELAKLGFVWEVPKGRRNLVMG